MLRTSILNCGSEKRIRICRSIIGSLRIIWQWSVDDIEMQESAEILFDLVSNDWLRDLLSIYGNQ